MRAFAKDMKVSNAFLCQILQGKRRLSEKRASEISDSLDLARPIRELFLLSVQIGNSEFDRVESPDSQVYSHTSPLQESHIALIEKVKASMLKEVSKEQSGSLTLLVDPLLIEEANRRIQKFQEELVDFLSKGNRTQPYHFSTCLIKVEKKR